LTTASNEGCTGNKSVIIKIYNTFYMPNAFTPNGDGKMMFSEPPDASIDLKVISIYDR